MSKKYMEHHTKQRCFYYHFFHDLILDNVARIVQHKRDEKRLQFVIPKYTRFDMGKVKMGAF